ncbi:MAG TPA: hypothetical protein VFZ34_26510 [Blastocatellia bacterium]|nr:hypothetical protein [Blastocatellia bacterium]
MPRGTNFDPNQHITKALAAIDAQIAQLQSKRDQLASIVGGGKKAKAAGAPKAKRAMSEEAKQKIREAQQKRWAEAKAKGGAKKKK